MKKIKQKDLKPFVMFETNEGKVFGIRSVRLDIKGDKWAAVASVGGDNEAGMEFIKGLNAALKKYCQDNYLRYGVVNPNA